MGGIEAWKRVRWNGGLPCTKKEKGNDDEGGEKIVEELTGSFTKK